MDSREFLGLEPTHNPFRWKLPVTEGISTTGNFLFGGSGLGAAISALEGTSGRQCVWATALTLRDARRHLWTNSCGVRVACIVGTCR